MRAVIAALPPPSERLAGRDGRLRLLVLGGSQGAYALNVVLPQVLQKVAADKRPQVRHQSGAKHLAQTREIYKAADIDAQVDAFIDDMAAAYAWADLVVCRAGALTLAELCAAGLAAILVPFPAAVDDHQTHNASALVEARARAGGRGDGSPTGSAPYWRNCAMATAAGTRASGGDGAGGTRTEKPDAAARIADLCVEVAA